MRSTRIKPLHVIAELRRASPGHALLAVFATTLIGALAPTTVYVSAQLIGVVSSGPTRAVGVWAASLIVSIFALTTLRSCAGYSQNELGRRLRIRSQTRLFAALAEPVGLSELEDPDMRDEVQVAQQAAETHAMMLVASVGGVLQSIVSVGAFMSFLLAFDPLAAALMVLFSVPAFWLALREANEQMAVLRFNAPMERRRAFFRTLLLDAHALQEIRTFTLEKHFGAQMHRATGLAAAADRQLDRRLLRLRLGAGALTALGLMVPIWALTRHAAGGTLDVATTSLVISSALSAEVLLTALAGQVSTCMRALREGSVYETLVASLYDLGRDKGTGSLEGPFRELRFENVSFTYPDTDQPVLHDLSFQINAGEFIGLIGPNGAGKSTIFKLLCRLYEPSTGRILLNGCDIAELDPQVYRNQLAPVFQDFARYETTLRENIAIGDLEAAGDPQILDAVRRVGAKDILEELPAGLDTNVSRVFLAETDDRTRSLSGGQWQRVAIARSAMRWKRPLMLLDEPTSGLDPIHESEVSAALLVREVGRSVLCASHRLSNLRDADRILVLQYGRLTHHGTHEQLLETCDDYREMFTTQASGYQ